MPTNYLYGTILTGEAVAANNRGDNLGSTTTLQKVFHQDDVHTSVSAEAIRFAIRYRFQLEGLDVNRSYNSEENKLSYKDEDRSYWKVSDKNDEKYRDKKYIDDDLMGFMNAKAGEGEKEKEDEDEADKSKKRKPKRKPFVRTSPLAIGRAVSLRPYRGELSFNCVSGEKKKGELSLYAAEMHTTEYQYSFGLSLNDILEKENIVHLINAIIDPTHVAGNHSRFAYDFSPASIVLRVTNNHSSKIQNCFEHDEESRTFAVKRLIRRLKSKDIPAKELIIGGEIAYTEEGEELKNLGVKLSKGINDAANEARNGIAKMDKRFAFLNKNGEE